MNRISDNYPGSLTCLVLALPALALFWVSRKGQHNSRTTVLNGPPRSNFFVGVKMDLLGASDPGPLYENWAIQYGHTYQIPAILGCNEIVIGDPKAISQLCRGDTSVYVRASAARFYISQFFGRGLVWAEGAEHTRQRKSLAPAFAIDAVRESMNIFYDSIFKVKSAWDELLETSTIEDGAIIDAEKWLDNIGLAGFSHDFGCLRGNKSQVKIAFDAFGLMSRSITVGLLFAVGTVFPVIFKLPLEHNRVYKNLKSSLSAIADTLIEKVNSESQSGMKDKSIIGMLGDYHWVVVDWILIELARNLNVQNKLRSEILQFGSDIPTLDQLAKLPYLDAVVCEVLRLHPPQTEIVRTATEDNILPLSKPIESQSGELIDHLFIGKGMVVHIPLSHINTAERLWGEDAKKFVPTRWLGDGIAGTRAAAIQGFRHLLTFSDGTRACLGRNFAIAEIKAVVSVLVRHYTFAMIDGPETKIGSYRAILERPKVAGHQDAKVPLVIKPVV
ncbi:cytochrome P450 [Infundibulicybe gibba]|nr:cytochrome P450 [Infundibulicybe gibba]